MQSLVWHTLRVDITRQARLEHNAGRITTMISTDATRLDFATTTVHMYVLAHLLVPLLIPLLTP